MKPIVNLEEQPGKTVGNATVTSDDYDRLVESSNAIVRLPFPKGVFRFKTHEEADAWMEHYLLQAALKKSRDSHKEPI